MPALWNSFSACLGGRNDRIGEDRHNLLNRGGVIPLGLSSEFRIPSSEFGNAPCSMHHACYSTGALLFQHKVFKKLHQRSVSGAFLWLFW